MHEIECAPLLLGGYTDHLVQLGAAMLLLEGTEHAAAFDAGELAVITGENELGAGRAGSGGELGQMAAGQHTSLVDDQHRALIPRALAAALRVHGRSNCAGVTEAVTLHV